MGQATLKNCVFYFYFVSLTIKKPSKKLENSNQKDKAKEGLAIVDFRDTNASLFSYHIQVLNDQVFGGKSEGHVSVEQVRFLLLYFLDFGEIY